MREVARRGSVNHTLRHAKAARLQAFRLRRRTGATGLETCDLRVWRPAPLDSLSGIAGPSRSEDGRAAETPASPQLGRLTRPKRESTCVRDRHPTPPTRHSPCSCSESSSSWAAATRRDSAGATNRAQRATRSPSAAFVARSGPRGQTCPSACGDGDQHEPRRRRS